MELGLQRVRRNLLPLRERRQRQRQHRVARHQDQTQVHGRRQLGPLLEPVGALQPHQHQRRDHHDGRAVEHARQCRLADGQGGGLLAAAERRGLFVAVADGVHVNAGAHLLAAHQKHVEGAGAGDGGKWHEAAEHKTSRRREPSQTGHEAVEADGHGARRADGQEVGLGQLAVGQGRGLVGVGVVDGDVERLVSNLPQNGAGGLLSLAWKPHTRYLLEFPSTHPQSWRQHTGRDDQVGQHKGRHAKWQHHRLARVRVQRRVHNLLGRPQLGRHLLDLALLVGHNGLLGLLEPRPADKQRPGMLASVRYESQMSLMAPQLTLGL